MRRGSLALLVTVAAAVVIAMPAAGVDPGALASPDSAGAAARFVGGLFPPELAPAYLMRVVGLMAQTIAISVAGTVIAIGVAIPLALAALRLRGEERGRESLGTTRWSLAWAARLGVRHGGRSANRAQFEQMNREVIAGTVGDLCDEALVLDLLISESGHHVEGAAMRGVRSTVPGLACSAILVARHPRSAEGRRSPMADGGRYART
jgi:hypothetical protein